jgi:hypothetical protein
MGSFFVAKRCLIHLSKVIPGRVGCQLNGVKEPKKAPIINI